MKQKKNGSPVRGLPSRVTNEHLTKFAQPLARILFDLRERRRELTTDALWDAIKFYWTEREIQNAVNAFVENGRTDQFRKLLRIKSVRGIDEDGLFRAHGEIWGVPTAIATFLGADKKALIKRIRRSHIRTLKGKDRIGRPATFFSLSGVKRACSDILGKRVLTTEDGTAIVGNRVLGTVAALSRVLPVSDPTIRARLKGEKTIKTIPGRDPSNHPVDLYTLKDIERLCCDLVRPLPIADRSGFFTHRGELWGTVKAIATYVGSGEKTVSLFAARCPTMEGRDCYRRIRTFYRLADVRESLRSSRRGRRIQLT